MREEENEAQITRQMNDIKILESIAKLTVTSREGEALKALGEIVAFFDEAINFSPYGILRTAIDQYEKKRSKYIDILKWAYKYSSSLTWDNKENKEEKITQK